MNKVLLASGVALSCVILGPLACSSTSGGSGVNGGAGGFGGSGLAGGNGGSGAIIATDGGGTGGTPPGADPKTCAEAAAAKTYVGCDFWPTPVTNSVWNIFDFAVIVANAGDLPAAITITMAGNQVAAGVVQPNSLEKFYLPWVPALKPTEADECGSSQPVTTSLRAPQGAYNLTSSVPVTVYQFNALQYKGQGGPPGKNWASCKGNQICAQFGQAVGCFSYSNDASLLLPSTAMTGNYRVSSLNGFSQGGFSTAPYVAIVGTADNTSVTVKASQYGAFAAGGGIQATGPNQSTQFTVGKGEVVEIFGTGTTDLGGTLVQASAPVQVIAGVPCVTQPFGQPACDHVAESVFPAETLGKRYFVTMPTGPNGDTPGHVVRIIGNVDGTTLTYAGSFDPGWPTSINAGQVADLRVVKGNFEVTADQAIAVASFQLGGSVVDPNAPVGDQKGDPAQSQMTAVEQYRTKYVFLAPDDYQVSYVDVVMPMGAQVTLDGAPLPATPQPLSGGYGIARAKLGPGQGGAHVLRSDVPVGIQVVGYGAYTSYQYPGGLNLSLIAPPPVK